jgi:hypothetical protein
MAGPKRPARMLSRMKAWREASVGCSLSGICTVLMRPGATQLTVMPWGTSSNESARDQESSAALAGSAPLSLARRADW